MAALALSAWSALTKKIYKDSFAEIEIGMSPFLDSLTMEGGWVGDQTYNVPIVYGRGQGTGASFADAQSETSGSKHKRPAITPVKMFGVVNLEDELIAFAKPGGAPVSAMTYEVDGVKRQLTADLCHHLYGTGGGARGKRASASTNVITLTNKWDTVHFFEGMYVRASANEDASSPRTGVTTVASVDYDAGTVTLTDASQLLLFADADYLFRSADVQAGTSKCLTGLGSPFDTTSKKGWLPNTAPTSGDSFFGIDRSANTAALAGWRITDTTMPIGDALIEAGHRAMHFNARIDKIYANPMTIANVIKLSGSKIFRDQGGSVTIGFSGITAELPTGTAKIMADPFCPTGRVYGLSSKRWFLRHTESRWINFAERDGNIWRIKASTMDYEARLVSYHQLYCTAPGENFVIVTANA